MFIRRTKTTSENSLASQLQRSFSRSKRVLFVDDDVELCRFMERAISRRFKVEIVSVPRANQARELLAEDPGFDAAIFDVRVTNGDGIQLYADVKDAMPGLKVVFLTGYYSDEIRRKIEAIGPARVYSKDRAMQIDFMEQLLRELGVADQAPPQTSLRVFATA